MRNLSHTGFRRFGFTLMTAVAMGVPSLCAAQVTLDGTPQADGLQHRPALVAPAQQTIALTVPTGTPLEIALDKEIRLERITQPVHGRVLEPVYAFDKLVIPAGSEVTGRVTQIESLSLARRTEAALDADFTPERKVQLTFTDVLLQNGRHMALETIVTPGSGNVLDFVAAGSQSPRSAVTGVAAAKVKQAKEQAHNEWAAALQQIKSRGKIHRVERYALAQLPVHPQYIDAGTIYFAELESPLEFGSEPLTREAANSLGDVPAEGSVVRARLVTGLSSANNRKDDPVEAIITRPVFENGQLILPQGSFLSGSVVQVRAARRLHRNGQLRVVFRELRLPDGVEQNVETSLEGIQTAKSDNVKLDSEGGAHASTPKTRYLSTAVALGLAGLSVRGDPDAKTPNPAGNTSNRIAGGAAGFKLVGIALGVLVHSRTFGYSMGAYGASMSVYSHFIARGRDIVFPQDTAMQLGLGTHEPAPVNAPTANASPSD
jgi:hypothetical protein